jgi:hypothetical protein
MHLARMAFLRPRRKDSPGGQPPRIAGTIEISGVAAS